MVAVLDSVPVALERIGAVTVTVAEDPEVRSTVVAMSPEPEAAPQAPVPVIAQVQLTEATSNSAGSNVSSTEAPTTSDGPLLVTTTV